jgi:TonB family protein
VAVLPLRPAMSRLRLIIQTEPEPQPQLQPESKAPAREPVYGIPAPAQPPAHLPRPVGFFISLAAHGLLIAWALAPGGPRLSRKAPSTYQMVFAPKEKKLIWYRFAPQQLPDVSPLKSAGGGRRPQGAVLSPQSIVAMPPKAKPRKQIILQPGPQLALDQEFKAPNLIAVSPANTPPPPKERPKPRAFIPPTDRPREAPKVAPVLTDAPSLETKGLIPETPKEIGNVTAGLSQVRRPVKKFSPPSAVGRSNGNQAAITLDAGSVPAIPGGATPETFSTAIIGLNPAASLEIMPEGSRPGQLSTGPNRGAPSSGSGGNGAGPGGDGGIRIPDLSIRGGGKKPPDALSSETTTKPNGTIEYQQTVFLPGRTTLSVPLRPSSRSIPQALEARFRGRNVYTILIPMPKLPQYFGDWIVWFAEREQKPGEAPQMRAPMPARKIDVATSSGGNPLEGRVQLAATILKSGRIESITVLKSFDPRLNQAAVEDLQKWQFTPASRSGEALDVEIVIEIPFRLVPSS